MRIDGVSALLKSMRNMRARCAQKVSKHFEKPHPYFYIMSTTSESLGGGSVMISSSSSLRRLPISTLSFSTSLALSSSTFISSLMRSVASSGTRTACTYLETPPDEMSLSEAASRRSLLANLDMMLSDLRMSEDDRMKCGLSTW